MQPPTEKPDRSGTMRATSLVIVNTGDGKGKSTAALGVALRARARGWSVAMLQFVKSGGWKVGEESLGRELGIDWWNLGEGFTWDSEDLDASAARAREAWGTAAAVIGAGEHELVILDEITYLMTWGWIEEAEVIATITGRPDHVNIVATGRDAPAALIEVADTVTEMVKIKHAFDAGVAAMRGLDY